MRRVGLVLTIAAGLLLATLALAPRRAGPRPHHASPPAPSRSPCRTTRSPSPSPSGARWSCRPRPPGASPWAAAGRCRSRSASAPPRNRRWRATGSSPTCRWRGSTPPEPSRDGTAPSSCAPRIRPARSTCASARRPTGVVEVDAKLSDPTGVLLTASTFRNDSRQRFLGFGERSDAVDQTGRVVEQWNEEGPFSAGVARPVTDPVLGEDWQGPPPVGPSSNFTMPWAVSSRGYGFLLDSTWLNRFDLTSSERWRVETAEPALRWRVYAGPEPADVLRRVTDRPARRPAAGPGQVVLRALVPAHRPRRLPRLAPLRVAHARGEGRAGRARSPSPRPTPTTCRAARRRADDRRASSARPPTPTTRGATG